VSVFDRKVHTERHRKRGTKAQRGERFFDKKWLILVVFLCFFAFFVENAGFSILDVRKSPSTSLTKVRSVAATRR